MESIKFYAGIDVSKSWLDIAVYQTEKEIVYRGRIGNNKKSVRIFLKELKKALQK